MENSKLNQAYTELDALLQLVKTLRGKNGCPWDKKQTPETISIYLVEEAFELADAIETGDSDQIRDELGDVLFHIIFIARMFQERGEFNLAEVARAIRQKMIRRHPHVFGEAKINSSEEVIQNWHQIKLDEKKSSKKNSLLGSVPAKLPALMRAYRISERVAKTVFDDTNFSANLANLQGVLDQIKAESKCREQSVSAEQIGDLLFALVNIARLAKIHPESALAGAVKRFEQRFTKMEELVSENKQRLEAITQEEKKRIWEKLQKSVVKENPPIK